MSLNLIWQSMSQIVKTPNQILIKTAQPVKKIDAKIKSIISDMKKTLAAANNPKGVGLAAPQIGVSLRIFIIKPKENSQTLVFINPEIVAQDENLSLAIDKKSPQLEGCLSIPRVWGQVKRHKSLTLKYQDENGRLHQKEFTGFPAVIIQHELDHLDGILFPRRVLEQKGKLYQLVKDANGKEVLEEMEI